ncbi:hypothetical protein Scep_011822 [Stephania cephalantha]|uniref:Uncharacterized protein n=1 Tax=Stephania cephalantha TaxID=152367 RepID=A0AAP0P6W7_9MAGN
MLGNNLGRHMPRVPSKHHLSSHCSSANICLELLAIQKSAILASKPAEEEAEAPLFLFLFLFSGTVEYSWSNRDEHNPS